ncbi:hypothetical protein Q9K01_10500 [Qipengyuania sp. DY56-A-20]|uniref:Uncharacterized protein n=1 Tax=Qipengyuania benthica TaxID=3067651 RepID=A0ABT9H9W3_9SPHN|nr:hypothetical protein [Qipengyuania sp. DY56-A-20]MDP4540056.1 hypothetical protein [Qipengyuania sp. DY56-A-20]
MPTQLRTFELALVYRDMHRSLISPQNTFWQNVWGVLAAAVIIPVAVLLKLVMLPFERPMNRTPEEVVGYLREFIDGTGGEWDWDDFVSIRIADPHLDSIRERASKYADVGQGELQSLLREAEALESAPR